MVNKRTLRHLPYEGKPIDDITYLNGKKSGLELRYHESGKLKTKSNYKDGEYMGYE